MNAPALPEVDRLVDELVPDIATATPSPSSMWHIHGRPTGGKSAVLTTLAERLAERGLCPVLVAPPVRVLDAGPLAVAEVSVGLKAGGLLDGQFELIRSSEARWLDKLDRVLDWVGEHADRVVLLCDEPGAWCSWRSEDVLFRDHAEEIAVALLTATACRRVVTGALPVGVRARRSRYLEIASEPVRWLRNEDEWGPLAATASGLAARLGDDLRRRSPLEVRLLVALGALWTVDEVARWWELQPSRRDISRMLASLLKSGDDGGERRFLREAWRRLALVRRPLDHDLLEKIVRDAPTERSAAILHKCLLYPENGAFRLHWTLRLDAHEHDAWWGSGDAARVHGELARYYKARFEARHKVDDPGALLDEMEAFHHASLSGDARLFDELRPYFADQLDMLGRSLSRDFKRYREAAAVFERAVKWEPGDDYAHHYLAFNLDVLAERALDVETHYRRAIELRPTHLWWHSRWVSYLITRGRMTAARRAWNEALDALGLPDDRAEQWVYENLHLWVARLLVHRGRLEFAEEVLRGIPARVRENHPGLAAVLRRLRALIEARRAHTVFPLCVPYESWWRGPHLCPGRRPSGELVRWMPGRIDAIDDGVVRIQAAQPPKKKGEQPVFGLLHVDAEDFDRWTRDERVSELRAGRFIELAWYGEDEEPIIRVHPDVTCFDPDLPPLFPDPARYLRSEGWVEESP